MSDIETMQIIRDAFLAGRDLEALELMRTLSDPYEPKYHNKILAINGNQSVLPDETVMITGRSFVPFKPKRIAMPARLSRDFFIHDIRVGVNSQLLNSDGIDGELLAAGWTDDPAEVYSHSIELEGEDRKMPVLTVRIDAKVISRTGIAIDMPLVMPGLEIIIQATNQSGAPRSFRSILLGYTKDA